MIYFTEDQADRVRGDYAAGRLDPVRIVPGLYQLPERLIEVFPDAGLDQYPTTDDLLATGKSHMLAQLSARREQAETAFSYGGVPVKLDEGTTARLAAASAGLARKPSGETVDWQLARDVFQALDLAALEAFGDAAFDHVQACFANARTLAEAINAAADLDALRVIDLDAGWPI